MPVTTTATASGLCAFVDASPSPFHVVETVATELRSHGFRELSEAQPWTIGAVGRYFVIRGGSLLAWAGTEEPSPFRVVGAHTDSPNLRVKQHPDLSSARLAAGRARALRRRLAQLLAGPRARHLRAHHAA